MKCFPTYSKTAWSNKSTSHMCDPDSSPQHATQSISPNNNFSTNTSHPHLTTFCTNFLLHTIPPFRSSKSSHSSDILSKNGTTPRNSSKYHKSATLNTTTSSSSSSTSRSKSKSKPKILKCSSPRRPLSSTQTASPTPTPAPNS